MRIVGGTMRKRPLATPQAGDVTVRPTTDRVRESLFNIIGAKWPDRLQHTRVLDLFAGTGALGCEALSRGAAFCLFIENAGTSRALIRRNVETLQLQGTTQIFRRDATRLGDIGTMKPFDLVFLDPPYGRGLGEMALAGLIDGGWLSADALVILEEADSACIELPTPYIIRDERKMGATVLRFLHMEQL